MIAGSVIAAFDGAVQLWTTSRDKTEGFQHVPADLADPAQTAAMLEVVQPHAVLHLAGSTGPSLSNLVESNVVATVNLMQGVAEGTHVVVVGSAAEYGTGGHGLVDEDVPLRPVSRYGWAKLTQTESAVAIAQRRNLTAAIARPFNVVGPSLPRLTAFGNIRAQITSAEPGKKTNLTTGRLDITRDLVPIDFVAEVLVAMTTDIGGKGVFNICTGHGFVLSEVVEAMARLAQADITLRVDPDLAAIPAVDRIVGDPRKVLEIYGLRSEPTVDGIAETIIGHPDGSPGARNAGVPSTRRTTQASQEQ